MEAENQQVKEIIQPLLDTETGFVKVRCWRDSWVAKKVLNRKATH